MRLIMRLLRYLGIRKKRVVLSLVGLTLGMALIQAAPLMLKYIIDDILTPMMMNHTQELGRLLQFLGLNIGIFIVANGVTYVAYRSLMDCANAVAEYLRNMAYDKMQQLPISYFDDKPAGKISARIVNDTETLRSQFYASVLSQFLIQLLLVVFGYAILFYLNVWLGMGLLILLPLVYAIERLYSAKTTDAMKDFYEAQSEVNTYVNEAMNGSVIIQSFAQEEAVTSRFEQVARRMLNANHVLVKMDALLTWNATEVLQRTTIILILSVLGQHFIGGALGMTTGLLFSYITYTERLFGTMGNLSRMLPELKRSMTTAKRVFELLDAPIEEDCTQELVVTEGVVVFENVSFGYNPEHYVLKNINITANKGETVALVGHTGSGKSSIMNLLFRFYDPQEGRILIDGQAIQQYNRESVRSDMGIVLQDPYLFTGTIASNVSMDDMTMSQEAIMDALVKVGAQPMIQRLAKGIDEPVREKGESFSSGERQLIAFARTLAANPKILILDEATSHIDTETEEVIQNAMNVVKQGRTTFIIAHRLSTIQNADQIIVLHEGQIVEQGTHTQLMAHNGKYAEMYRMQQKI